MDSFESFVEELKDALANMHDPDYELSKGFATVLRAARGQSQGQARARLLQAIEDLRSGGSAPTSLNTRREIDVLYHRFSLGLTQVATAHRLHMSLRTVQRTQHRAIRLLARSIWETRQARLGSDISETTTEPTTPLADESPEWLTQTSAELASLHRVAPGVQADICSAIEGAARIARVALSARQVSVAAIESPEDLSVTLHPTVLRQILLTAILGLGQIAAPGEDVSISAKRLQNTVQVIIQGRSASLPTALDLVLAEELLSGQGGRLSLRQENDLVTVLIDVPSASSPPVSAHVLVIDDNQDWISLYESYLAGTPYRMSHVTSGQQASKAIEALRPDVILLDVMLPDADGWDLLLDLHNDPDTRSIPVIISSVVWEEGLATSLGARLHLRKPVYRHDLLEAFERVLSPAASEPSEADADTP